MYKEFFGLRVAPFRITPDTRLFYTGGGRGDVLEAVVYAIESGEGVLKVVGEVGSGKTMLCRMLEERLPDDVEIVYLANPSLSPDDILQAIALEMTLPVEPDAKRLHVMHALQQRLLEMHARSRRVVVFIEEAQSMPLETLEEIRLLSNLETKREKLLQIVLFGQPELDEKLDSPDIRQLRERITHSFELRAFSPEEARDYVNFRLRAAGYRGADLFRRGAHRAISRASVGLTRRINILADKALLAAYAEDHRDVSARHVRIAINDTRFDRKRRRPGVPELTFASGVMLMIGALAIAYLHPIPAPWNSSAGRVSGPSVSRPGAEAPVRTASAAPVSGVPAAAATRAGSGAVPDGATGDGDAGEEPVAPASSPARPAREETADGARAPSPPAASAPITEMAQETGRGESGPRRETASGPGEGTTDESEAASVRVAVAADDTGRVASAVARGPVAPATGAGAAQGAPAPDVAEPDSSSPAGAGQSAPAREEPGRDAPPDDRRVALVDASSEEAREAVEPVPVAAPAPDPAPQRATVETPTTSDRASVVAPAPDESAGTGFEPEPATRSAYPDLLARRIQATRHWLAAADAEHYSIQLLLTGTGQMRNLEAFLERRRRAGELDHVYVYETRIRGREMFGVLYRDFASYSAARRALGALSTELTRLGPFIRNVGDVTTLG